MQAISLGDTLFFKENAYSYFSCSNPNIPTDETNGVRQACALFRNKTGYQVPIRIHLEKHIPIEGGFGGGSGNIATTLWALKELSRKSIDEATLANWASTLSCDAPFFFSTGTAYATGRGEIIQSLPPFKPQSLFVVKPTQGLSTPLVYEAWRSHAFSHASYKNPQQLLKKAVQGSIEGINDLEQAAFFLYPELKKIKQDLINLGFSTVAMTGSGSGLYCLGAVENPTLLGLQFWKTSYLSRKEKWYSFIS